MAVATTVVDVVTQVGDAVWAWLEAPSRKGGGKWLWGQEPLLGPKRWVCTATRALAPSERLHSSEMSDLPFRVPPHCPNQLGGGGGEHLSTLTLTLKGGQRREVRGPPSPPCSLGFPRSLPHSQHHPSQISL